MKHLLAVLFIVSFLSIGYSYASTTKEMTLNQTVNSIQKALLNKDMAVLNEHVDIDGIVAIKVRKYSNSAQKKNSLIVKSAGKLAGMGEPIIVSSIVKLAMSEYEKSDYATRKAYMSSVVINKMGQKGMAGFASGKFLDKPFVAAFLFINNKWVAINIDSPLIDQEIKRALKSMKVIG